ncbi:mechanosensitive ion channel family protein [Roseomonas acroporae]|uniref:mechanosensitive ion channel family protein n=1 Tax=Roseomonas acroporae TaxID=2937791 RepID=UPI0024A63CE6|nr:mechanosensitive ion channel domain-containing protein [Roseomonas acroporae]
MLNNVLTASADAIREALGWAPGWLVGTVILIAAASVPLLLFRLILRRLYRFAGRFSPFAQTLIGRSQWPLCAMLVLLAMGFALPTAQFVGSTTIAIAHLLLGGFVLTVGWMAVTALRLSSDLYLSRVKVDIEDNLLARKAVTQVRILRGAAQTLIIIVTVGAALMTSDQVRQYGVSLFASAGAAGLVLGLAARPLLANLLAGIQIALTQPIRLEDAVVVEGEWGWVESIGSTYVVIRVWDLRRLIVPLSYFIEKPFQNWTHESADLLGSVFLHVDYGVPLDRLRARLQEIVRASPLWDRKVAVLQVTDAPANMVELRILVSARSGPAAFDLRCEVREKMIDFLQSEYPDALPRQRTDITGDGRLLAAGLREGRSGRGQAPPERGGEGHPGRDPARGAAGADAAARPAARQWAEAAGRR